MSVLIDLIIRYGPGRPMGNPYNWINALSHVLGILLDCAELELDSIRSRVAKVLVNFYVSGKSRQLTAL